MSLQAFLDSLDGWPSREEMYDVGAMGRLGPADWTAAEDALIARSQAGDPRAALTLGAIGATRALPALRALSTPFARRAVLALEPSDAAAQAVARDLESASMYDRLAAVEALGAFRGPVAQEAIAGALDDVDHEVRRRAAQLLLKLAGLWELTRTEDGDSEPCAPLEHLCWLLSSDLKATYLYAAKKLRQTVSVIAEGVKPSALDLEYRPGPDRAFRVELSEALAGPDDPIPFDLIRRNGDHAERFAETVLTLRLDPHTRDPRAPGALAELGATWARASMEEAIVGLEADHPFAEAVTAALARM